MAKAIDVIKRLENLSPNNFAANWDNVGFLLGRNDKLINKAIVCVDVDEDIIDKAIANKVDLIVSHHPLIFSGIKRITNEDFMGKRLIKLIQADICVYSMHTNFDVMGMADAAAEKIDLMDTKVLEVTYEDDIATEGFGRVGQLKQDLTLEEVAKLVKDKFKLESVKVFGTPDNICCDVAICPGSGKSMAKHVVKAGVDVFISGDIDHHTGIDLVAEGIAVIDAGHYGLEKIFIPYVTDYINKTMQDIIVLEDESINPFWVF